MADRITPGGAWRRMAAGLAAVLLLVAGGFMMGAGTGESDVEGTFEEPAIWCPCTNSYVNRVSDCPDCKLDGLDVYASPPVVTVRGNKVQGQINTAVGRNSADFNMRFTWSTGDTLRTNGGFHVGVKVADGSYAGWQGQAAFKGRFHGTKPGRTTAVIQLIQDAGNVVVYSTPAVPIVITP